MKIVKVTTNRYLKTTSSIIVPHLRNSRETSKENKEFAKTHNTGKYQNYKIMINDTEVRR